MAKNRPSTPKHKANEKRAQAKLKRGFGRLAMKAAGYSENEMAWAQKHDPLYKVKGKARHQALNN
jgi:hypothetical protein